MRMHYLILSKSLTHAQRTARLLQREGVFASVTKAPQSANPGGCTYGVKIGARNLERAQSILQEAGLAAEKLFSVDAHGRINEVEQ